MAMLGPARNQDLRACFVGDSFVVGVGDSAHQGWVGRVAAQAEADGFALTTYNLGVRRDTSADIVRRLYPECACRLRLCDWRLLVLAFGVNDVTSDIGAVPEADTRRHTADLLVQAGGLADCVLLIGPTPIQDPSKNVAIAARSAAIATVARDYGIPYLEIFPLLIQDPAWMRALAAGDGSHPSAPGYACMAEHILTWDLWPLRSVPP